MFLLQLFFIKECDHGQYGFNCDKSCDGCLSDDCDRNFGKCKNTSGCKPGKQSGQEKCDLGMFNKYCPFSLLKSLNINIEIAKKRDKHNGAWIYSHYGK